MLVKSRSLFLMSLIILCGINQAQAILTLKLTKSGDHQAVPIAVIPFAGNQMIGEVISDDLTHSGQFKSRQHFKQQPHLAHTVSYPYWQRQNIDNMVVGQVVPIAAGRVMVRVALLSIYGKHQLFDRDRKSVV